ncbi:MULTISPECIES: hypothetical protein [unclassified Bacillus (in: firmicutes)]|uniref:hypothetical protein n=1 Tax=unclassified Bacillus (in: firmicutes) TaxID=185979 RepID=UPI0008F26DE1|nr:MULTISPECIES: hypothetical protein [unclassified Bacillus (in: firmicutes)]SFA86900.1 hypothetical protein SAMN02799634_102176 [Bacillus sp. UNCCL13]SFQ83938.1 hypothetical protein SAMN04488577_2296 [Bacillus sp. cl95]
MYKQPNELTKVTFYQEDTEIKLRRSTLSGFQQPIFLGGHGSVKQYCSAEPELELPSTIDYIVATAGG